MIRTCTIIVAASVSLVVMLASSATAATVQDAALSTVQGRLSDDVTSARQELADLQGQLDQPELAWRETIAGREVLQQLMPALNVLGADAPAAAIDAELGRVADMQSAEMTALVDDVEDAQYSVASAQRRLAAFERASDQEAERATDLGDTSDEPSPVPGDLSSYGLIKGFGGTHTAGVSVDTINEYLADRNSPMAGQGEAFLTSGLRWRIDPRLLVAIAGAESAFGQITCAPYNAWGWGCPVGPYRFEDWSDGIDAVAKGLRTNYLNEGRTSVRDIHAKYAPIAVDHDPNGLNLVWSVNVGKFLLEQGGDPADVRGPSAAAAGIGDQP